MPLSITELSLSGAYEITTKSFSDHRGVFARWFCSDELKEVLGKRKILNINFSATTKKGAVRGLHFQNPPKAEMKMVRCIKGVIYDVLVDIRKNSPTFLQWCGIELSADKMNMAVIPEGFAHGFQALTDNVEFLYLTTEFYSPEYESGLSLLDPVLGIELPLSVAEISLKDKSWPMIRLDDFSGIDI